MAAEFKSLPEAIVPNAPRREGFLARSEGLTGPAGDVALLRPQLSATVVPPTRHGSVTLGCQYGHDGLAQSQFSVLSKNRLPQSGHSRPTEKGPGCVKTLLRIRWISFATQDAYIACSADQCGHRDVCHRICHSIRRLAQRTRCSGRKRSAKPLTWRSPPSMVRSP